MKIAACLITREIKLPQDANPSFGFHEVHVGTHSTNVLRRYELAANVDSDHVYVQDDDCRIDVPTLVAAYDGARLTHAMLPGHATFYEGTGVTLIGWGALFPTAWARAFISEQALWRQRFGNALFEMECDRVFTFIHRRETKTVFMPVTQYQRAERMSDRPEHYRVRADMIERLNRLHREGAIA